MAFESNVSKQERQDDFRAQGPGYRLALSPHEATFQLAKNAASILSSAKHRGEPGETLTMQLVGADPSAHAVQNAVPTGHANYFVGSDRSKWRTDIPLYDRVEYRQVYRGIDLAYYGSQSQLEYDFLVRPGTDPGRIGLKFAGARTVRIAANGELVLGLREGEVRWHRPLTYQMIAGRKRMVASSFVLKTGGEIGFRLARYDTARPITIDPKLIYSTFLGGHAFTVANALAVDSAGNTFVAGVTNATDFPITAGAFQKTSRVDPNDLRYRNRGTAFVAKLNPTGTAYLYATFLGGSGADTPTGIAIDSQGNAYVTGAASSLDFPVTPGAFQTINPENRETVSNPNSASANYSATVFITKLNSTGSALIYSTYLGGHTAYSEMDTPAGIALDVQGNAYVTGFAYSLDFPTTSGAFQTTVTSKGNSFITKLNPTGTALVYSTYMGGTGTQCRAITVDGVGSAYVTGQTYSPAFPTTPGAFEPNTPGLPAFTCAFVTKLNPAGTALAYSTCLGKQSKGSNGLAIAVDTTGSAYITGAALSIGFPLTPGAFQRTKPQDNVLFPGYDIFVVRFTPDGGGLIYSANLGRGSGLKIALDSAGSACIAGTAYKDFPTTTGAFQRNIDTVAYVQNAFVTRLNTSGTALLYSTFLPSANNDPSGIAVDNLGNVTVGGSTYEGSFYTTPGVLQQATDAASGSRSGYVTRIAAHQLFPDFNADGSTDLLLKNRVTGVVGTWFLNGADVVGGVTFSQIPPPAYTLVGTGDFKADGVTTLVFQNSVDNGIVFWYTGGANSAAVTGGDFVLRTVEAGWKLVGVADFSQDGRSDLLFQNQMTGRLVLWNMNGPSFQSGVAIPQASSVDWKVVGTGDFNGDGFADIVFQNATTGKIKIWFMSGTAYAGEGQLTPTAAPGWNVVGVGDYNGDGHADLLLQNQTTNQSAVWYLNGILYVGGSGLSQNPPLDWKFVGPH